MIADGFKDITLLGQNVNSYNSPVTDENGLEVDFPKLLHILNNLEGDFRIRFMTSNPKDCSDELLEAMRDCRKVAKHLHLPFQSGSTEVLKRMNRKYDREKYLNLVKKAKELVPEISLTSDVIVGFPGETYEDFCETLSLVKEVKFSALFTFIFSPRNGTVAAQMEDPVSRKEKGKWFRELLKIQEEIAKENEKALSDKTFRLLCDDFGRQEGFMAGHTDTNICLEFKADSSLLGKFVNVKTKYVDGVLTAEII
jgi:tRNA-2-methylthio-N6-dimethylallyladenosine synthase